MLEARHSDATHRAPKACKPPRAGSHRPSCPAPRRTRGRSRRSSSCPTVVEEGEEEGEEEAGQPRPERGVDLAKFAHHSDRVLVVGVEGVGECGVKRRESKSRCAPASCSPHGAGWCHGPLRCEPRLTSRRRARRPSPDLQPRIAVHFGESTVDRTRVAKGRCREEGT